MGPELAENNVIRGCWEKKGVPAAVDGRTATGVLTLLTLGDGTAVDVSPLEITVHAVTRPAGIAREVVRRLFSLLVVIALPETLGLGIFDRIVGPRFDQP